MNLKVLLLLLLTCSGCSLIGNGQYTPLPNKINTKPVEWKVLTPEIMDEYLTDLKEGNAPTNVYYGVSPVGYENLSVNMAEIKRYIRQILSIVTYYKELDEPENKDE